MVDWWLGLGGLGWGMAPGSDPRIRQLENELDTARRAVLGLLPDTIREFADTCFEVETRDGADEWGRAFVKLVIASAVIIEEADRWNTSPRARCPLCHADSAFSYDVGFAVPEGLRRHLEGRVNAPQCDVAAVVLARARETWGPRIERADQRIPTPPA